MSGQIALPVPDLGWPVLAPMWRFAASGEFRLPRCSACGQFDWYPTGRCGRCGGEPVWSVLSGHGTLYSWAHVHRALEPALGPLCPYLSAIVTIAEDHGTRFVTRLVDVNPSALTADMPVSVRFVDLGYPAVKTGITAALFSVDTA